MNTPVGESRKKKAVDLLLSRDMSVLQFIEDGDFLGSRIQTEYGGFSFYPHL